MIGLRLSRCKNQKSCILVSPSIPSKPRQLATLYRKASVHFPPPPDPLPEAQRQSQCPQALWEVGNDQPGAIMAGPVSRRSRMVEGPGSLWLKPTCATSQLGGHNLSDLHKDCCILAHRCGEGSRRSGLGNSKTTVAPGWLSLGESLQWRRASREAGGARLGGEMADECTQRPPVRGAAT